MKLFQYKIEMQKILCGTEKARVVYFCGDFNMFLEGNPQSILFNAEDFFNMNGFVNKQNIYVCLGLLAPS